MRNKTAVQVKANRVQRLLRFACAVVGSSDRLTSAQFAEDAEGYSPMRWELREFGELDRRLGDTAHEQPTDRHGFFRWRLSPTSALSLDKLDQAVETALRRACAASRLATRRKMSAHSIRYRFLIHAESHAHVGVLAFVGPSIERLLPETE